MASSLSLVWFSIQWSLGDPYDVTLLRCVCWDRWTLSLWSGLSFYIHESYLSFFDLLYAQLLVASYFFSDIWVLFCQLDLFILQWEGVLCDGFDLTVLDPNDRKGTDTYVSLLLRIKRWDLYLHNIQMDLVYIMSSFLLHYSVSPWT